MILYSYYIYTFIKNNLFLDPEVTHNEKPSPKRKFSSDSFSSFKNSKKEKNEEIIKKSFKIVKNVYNLQTPQNKSLTHSKSTLKTLNSNPSSQSHFNSTNKFLSTDVSVFSYEPNKFTGQVVINKSNVNKS